jgi:hypothetical protein
MVRGRNRGVDLISAAQAPDMRSSWRGLMGIAEHRGWVIGVVNGTSWQVGQVLATVVVLGGYFYRESKLLQPQAMDLRMTSGCRVG